MQRRSQGGTTKESFPGGRPGRAGSAVFLFFVGVCRPFFLNKVFFFSPLPFLNIYIYIYVLRVSNDSFLGFAKVS